MNNSVIRKIYREKDINKIQRKINMLGNDRKLKFDAVTFLNIRMITTILLGLMLIVFSNEKYFLIPFIIIIYYNAFYYLFITNNYND